MSFLRLAARSITRPRFTSSPRVVSLPHAVTALPSSRGRVLQYAAYSAAAGLSKGEITARVLDVLKGFEKVDPTKVLSTQFLGSFRPTHVHHPIQLTETSKFSEDLGLDSLDAVEVVMAVEEVRMSCV